jgi:hypothetical protein
LEAASAVEGSSSGRSLTVAVCSNNLERALYSLD